MIMKKACLSVIIFLLITVCFASSLIGRWSGTIGGQFEVVVDLKEEGEGKLSGIISSQIGDVPISGGKIAGDSIVFKDVSFNGLAVSYIKGKIAGDTMHVTVGFQGQDFKGKLTRVKNKIVSNRQP